MCTVNCIQAHTRDRARRLIVCIALCCTNHPTGAARGLLTASRERMSRRARPIDASGTSRAAVME